MGVILASWGFSCVYFQLFISSFSSYLWVRACIFSAFYFLFIFSFYFTFFFSFFPPLFMGFIFVLLSSFCFVFFFFFLSFPPLLLLPPLQPPFIFIFFLFLLLFFLSSSSSFLLSLLLSSLYIFFSFLHQSVRCVQSGGRARYRQPAVACLVYYSQLIAFLDHATLSFGCRVIIDAVWVDSPIWWLSFVCEEVLLSCA